MTGKIRAIQMGVADKERCSRKQTNSNGGLEYAGAEVQMRGGMIEVGPCSPWKIVRSSQAMCVWEVLSVERKDIEYTLK